MKFSILAVALLASTALVSVTSAAGKGGVRGSIDKDFSNGEDGRVLDKDVTGDNAGNGDAMDDDYAANDDYCARFNFLC